MGDVPLLRFLTRTEFDGLSYDEQLNYLRIAAVALAKRQAVLRAEIARLFRHTDGRDRADEEVRRSPDELKRAIQHGR